MIPIILCGIAATYIIIERLLYFKNLRKNDSLLKLQLNAVLLKKDYEAATALCVSCETPFSQVVQKAISVRNLEDKYLKEIVETEMEAVIPQYTSWNNCKYFHLARSFWNCNRKHQGFWRSWRWSEHGKSCCFGRSNRRSSCDDGSRSFCCNSFNDFFKLFYASCKQRDRDS